MLFKVCRVVNVHMLIRAKKELLSSDSIIQRSESLQSRLSSQISILFNYF